MLDRICHGHMGKAAVGLASDGNDCACGGELENDSHVQINTNASTRSYAIMTACSIPTAFITASISQR